MDVLHVTWGRRTCASAGVKNRTAANVSGAEKHAFASVSHLIYRTRKSYSTQSSSMALRLDGKPRKKYGKRRFLRKVCMIQNISINSEENFYINTTMIRSILDNWLDLGTKNFDKWQMDKNKSLLKEDGRRTNSLSPVCLRAVWPSPLCKRKRFKTILKIQIWKINEKLHVCEGRIMGKQNPKTTKPIV